MNENQLEQAGEYVKTVRGTNQEIDLTKSELRREIKGIGVAELLDEGYIISTKDYSYSRAWGAKPPQPNKTENV